MLDVPETKDETDLSKKRFRVQLIVSWPFKGPNDEVKSTDAARLIQMRERATGFSPRIIAAIEAIPEGSPVTEISLADWPCREWDNHGGLVTLVGDAAHAMTMYRGEAGNHGILDAYELCLALESNYHGADQKTSIDKYEAEMRERAGPAALLSRQACVDAHDWDSLNEKSAV